MDTEILIQTARLLYVTAILDKKVTNSHPVTKALLEKELDVLYDIGNKLSDLILVE